MDKQYRYTLRKTTLGLASVAIAAFLAGQVPAVYAADEESTSIVGEALPPIVGETEDSPIEPAKTSDYEDTVEPAKTSDYEDTVEPAKTSDYEDAVEPATTSNLENSIEPDAVPTLKESEETSVVEQPEGISNLSITPYASSAEPDGLELSENPQPTRQMADATSSEPNYAEDEKSVGDYRDTQLERGEGPVAGFNTPDERDKFIDGYRYKNLEPGATSPDKTKWGFEIEIDKEKGQRTYTDFGFTNSGLLGAFLPGGTNANPVKVPSVEQGTKIGNDFKEANYKAESNIDLVASKTQRNLNLYASEEDLKHINSVDNKNTTMAWEGHYLKDNANGPKATEGDNAAFSFTVNPWPNENDKLSLITLSGSHDEKVFINGQTITTNVSVANLDANARERLVGQVYHPETGKVVPGARAYINDQDKVVIEMPQGAVNADGTVNKDSIFYKDKNYKGLQNLKVQFFARPRTADEFRAVIANNEGNYGTYTETGAGTATIKHKGQDVVIDKQGIARYDHYNKVGEFILNLDDTKYHDQDYVDQDGDLTESESASYVKPGVPYKVNNNNDDSIKDITEAVNKGHAHAALDLSLIEKINAGKDPDDQWQVKGTADALTEITITAPKSAKAGDFVSFSVKYTYTNGSVDTHKMVFVVKESGNNIPQYYSQVLYPTETATSLPHLSIKVEDEEKRKPVEYTIEDKTYFDDHGNEWTASIDSKTGIVTATPKVAKDFIGGEKLVVPVTAHYVEEENPDITFTEQARAAFVIKQKDNLPPRYDAKNGKAGETLTSKPIVKQDGGIDTRIPVSYSIDETEYTDNKGNTWTVSIDEKTGVVTANIPNIKDGDKLDGTIISVPVTAHYEENGQDVGTEVANAQFLASGTNNKIEHTEKIPFEVKVEENKELAKGEWRYKTVDGVEQTGQAGEIKTTWIIENSKIVDKTEEKTEPVAAIIEVGSKDFEGTLEYVDKDPIPFETEVIVDPSLAPNVIVVDQAGELGEQETKVTRTITNGEAGPEVRGETTRTKEPVTRKIRVGSNTKGQYKETEIIPFKTEVKKDPTLKKGEWKYAEVDGVQQTGENGLKERMVTIENSMVTAESEYKTIKEPKNAVILVGDEDFTGTLEYVDKDPVPFETEVTIDPSLEPNEIVEDQAGVLGEQETKVTREIKNGEAGEEVRGETTQTKAPINRKIRVGAKSNGTHTIEEKVEIPFETVVEFDDSLAPGEQKVTQEGAPGEKTRTTTLTIVNGEVTETKSGEFTETKAPTKKIIKVGRNTEGEVKHVEEIPFGYKVEEVDTLKKGEYEIVKPGKVGTKTTTWTIKNSKVDGEPKVEIVEPEDALIYVGKGTNSGTHEVVEKVPVPFETIIEFDDSLAPGEQKVTQEGKLGEKTRKSTLTIEDGEVTKTESGEFEQNIAPINRVIKVGRNTNGKVEHKEELPFKYTIQYDPSLEAGKYVVETPGVVGQRITTWTIENSKVVGEPSVVETQPVDAVIKVGSKDFTGTFTTTKTEAVPFETEYVVNNKLKPGEVNVKQEGQLGQKETQVTHTIVNGEVTESKEGETKQSIAPIKRIVEIGPGKTDGTHTYTSKKPFAVEVRVNPELKKGEHRVVQEGVEGEEEYTITIENSKVIKTSEPRETKAPVNEIIEVGSQDFTGTHETKKTRSIEYETEYVVDNSLEPGTTVVEQEGSLGEETITVTHTIVNGQVTESKESDPVQTKAPVKRIVKVGAAKTDGTHTYTSKIPYEVEIRVNPDLKMGERNVIQKGEAGEEKYTLTIENSKVTNTTGPVRTKEPKPEIIEVGSGDYTGVFEYVDKEVIPFDTKVTINPNLAPNEIKEITPGEVGSKERKVTQKYTNGEKGELVVGEYEITKEPVTRVIEVGSNTTGQYKETHVIPFETEVRKDPSIPKGEWRYAVVDGVPQTGKNGLKERTLTIENSIITSTSEFTTIEEPKNAIILVGEDAEDSTEGEVTHTEEIPFGYKIEVVDDLNAGEYRIAKPGKVGTKTTTWKIKDSQVDGEPTVQIVPAEDALIQVGKGTSEGTHEIEIVEKKEIPFETRIEYDENLEAGQREETGGTPGEQERTNTLVIEDGKVVDTKEGEFETTTEPKDKVIKIGIKPIVNEVEKPFETEYIYDENLEMGKEEEVTPGENGKVTITTSYDKEQGKIVTNEETKEPTNRVVNIGIKPTVNEETIPHNTQYQHNPELKAGEIRLIKEGIPGKVIVTTTFNKETGKMETKVERIEPTDAVYEYGSKTEGKVTVESDIPFEVEIIEDPEMEAGKTEVVQEGELGKKETTITIENSKEVSRDEKTIKDPVKKIVKVGTKCVCEIPPVDPKPEDPKPEDPKPEDPKPEDPKPEDPKPEDPKPEDPKPEDPKPEDPKPEDPKPEDPKPEDPKPEDPKPEDPKPEDPKPEDPKPEDPKPEDPKPEDPKPEDPKPEDPKPEDPKPEDPKPEDPKPEEPGKPEDPRTPDKETPSPEESGDKESEDKAKVTPASPSDDDSDNNKPESQPSGLLPQTGEADSSILLGASAVTILAGLGLVQLGRRKEEEA